MGRKGGDRAFSFRFHENLAQRVEVREVEVPVETVHREDDGLCGPLDLLELFRQIDDIVRVEYILTRPELGPSVADVAQHPCARIEARRDLGPYRRCTDFGKVDLLLWT